MNLTAKKSDAPAIIGGGRTGRKEIRQALAQTKEPIKPPEPIRVRPTFSMIMSSLFAGLSRNGAKNPQSVHTRITGHKSRKFKGYDRENRRYNSFNKKKR